MSSKKQVTNEEILELLQEGMQMTSDGFAKQEQRMDGMQGKMDGMQQQMDSIHQYMKTKFSEHDSELHEIKETVKDLANKHVAYISDISDLLDRVADLERRMPNITNAEVKELQRLLQAIVDWAGKAAKAINVPLRLPDAK